MKYGDLFVTYDTNVKTGILLCLGHNEDKKVTFLSFMFPGDNCKIQVGFAPYSTEVLEKEDIRFDGTASPNLSALEDQLKYYRDICDKCDFKDSMITCSIVNFIDMVKGIYKNFQYIESINMYLLPAVIPGDGNKLGIEKAQYSYTKTVSVGAL